MNTRVQHVVDTVEVDQKTAEVPPLQFTDKVVDIPVVAQRQIPKLQCTDQVVDVPAVLVVLVPQVQVVAETAETLQLLLVAQFPRVQVVEEAVKIPQLHVVEKIGEIPEWLNSVKGVVDSEDFRSRTRFCVSSRKRL